MGPLQLSAGQEAGAEATIHAMRDIFANRKVMPHNLNFLCPIITMYITNRYITPTILFAIVWEEILSKEGTTQGDSTAMGAYASGILTLIHFLLEFISVNQLSAKDVAFVDGFTVAGKVTGIGDYWRKLPVLGPKYGYFPKN